MENEQAQPAAAGPVDCRVRPRAWAWKDEPSGQEVYSGWEMPRPTDSSEPLYDWAALESAVAAERERIRRALQDMQAACTTHNYYGHAIVAAGL
jgi:hypothetical protein